MSSRPYTAPVSRQHPPVAAQRPASVASGGIPLPDLAALVATVLVWSSLHPIAKLTLLEITPLQLPFARVVLAAAFLAIVCAATGRLGRTIALFRPRELGKVVILGLTGFTFSSGLSMVALGYLPAGINSVLANTSPLMVALGLILLAGQRLQGRMVVGLAIGFVGVATIAVRGGVDASSLSIVGVVLSLVSAATWALYTVLARRLTAGHDALAMSAATSLIGSLTLGAAAVAEGQLDRLAAASSSTLLLLLWCGVIATGATFTMWVVLLRRVNPVQASSFQYLIPLSALVLACPILGEVPTPMSLFGAAMIVGGVAIANAASSRAPARRSRS